MTFCNQLKLLLWKNYCVRKRQKVRLAIEIIWPLVLFLILSWVRTRGLKNYIHECHFEEKALPSAGLMPFVRSFICSFNNTCHAQIVSADAGSSTAADNFSMFTNLADDLESVLNDRVHHEHLPHFTSVQNDIGTLQALIVKLQSRDGGVTGHLPIGAIISQKFLESQHNGIYKNLSYYLLEENLSISLAGLQQVMVGMSSDEIQPQDFICNETIVSLILSPDAEQKKRISEMLAEICKGDFNTRFQQFAVNLVENANLTKFLQEMSVLTESQLNNPLSVQSWSLVYKTLKDISLDMRSANSSQVMFSSVKDKMSGLMSLLLGRKSWKEMLSTVLCGNANFYNQIFEKDERIKIEDFRKRFRLRKKVNFFDDDSNSTSRECSILFHSLSENEATTFLWQQLKPFVVGKILYTPNTPVTNRIMGNVNESFSGIGDILNLASNWIENISPGLRNYLLNRTETIKFWQNITDPVVLKENPWISTILYKWLGSTIWGSSGAATSILERELEMIHSFFMNDALTVWENGLNQIDSVMNTAINYLKCFDQNKVEAWDDEKSALHEATRLMANNRLWAVVVFTNVQANNDTFPAYIRYKIRMDSDKVDSTKQVEDRIQRPGPRRRPGIDMKYFNYGFAFIQDLVEHSIIKEQTDTEDNRLLPGMWLQQFPYPCYIRDQFIMAISRSFPMFMTLAWVYTSAMIIKTVVQEKERRLKEFMKSMGLTSGVHWIGWFINSFIMMSVTVVLLTIVLKLGKVLENSDPSVIFVFLLCYTIATITKSFALSTLFSQANIAAAAGGIIFFVLHLPYAFLVLWEEHLNGYVKTLTSLLSNVAFGFGCSYFAQFEEMGVGLQWSNIWKSSLPNDTFNMASCMLMLLLDSAIYSIITWYIENAFPGEYGTSRPWYFPFTLNYWCNHKNWPGHKSHSYNNGMLMTNPNHGSDFEVESTVQSEMGVSIKNLRKVYSNGKVAVEDLSLNFYEDQITSFLGHNGAGKTTTISILTGMIPPSSGSATIYGANIGSDMANIRKDLGTCPQHNVLFDELTVEEHLWFYACLKGVSTRNVTMAVMQMLVDLGLPEKRQNLVAALSGGMQRKLSVAVAFVGGSRTVILDEPTAGVDPYSRRSIWELLLKYKQGRTIILTTHHMDEADLLGDRIAIIAHGRLRCCGSSLFLKSRFGQGYYLTMVKETQWNNVPNGITAAADEPKSQEICKTTEVTEFIQSVIPSARLLEDIGTEICYVLPNNAKCSGAFGQLFDKLDQNLRPLHVASYGISDTTLEEIFLRVAEGDDMESSSQNGAVVAMETFTEGGRIPAPPRTGRQRIASCTKVAPELEGDKNSHVIASSPIARKMGWALVAQHILALLIKRFHHSRRNGKGIVCEIILPALFVCLALASTLTLPPLQEEPSLELTPWIHGPPNYIFFSNVNPQDEITLQYEKTLSHSPWLGAQCMRGDPVDGKSCERDTRNSTEWVYSETEYKEPIECSCATGTPICPAEAGGPLGPHINMPTTDILVNMTGRNISDWLVKTGRQFYKRRYGGVTFGVRNPTAAVNVTALRHTWERLSKAANAGQYPANQSLEFFTQLDIGLKQMQIFDNIKVWFNNRGWTSSVSYLNAINNVVLRSHLGPNQDPELYGISVINHPINFTEEQLQEEITRLSSVSLLHSVCVIFAMSFVPASFVMHLIEERVSKSKHLQLVSGVSPVTYWVAHYIWDMISYMMSATLCILIFLIFNEDAYVSSENLPGLILLLTFYGFASIPMMYPFAYVFHIPSTAFVTLSCGNLFVGIVSTVATFILEVMEDDELKAIAAILKEVFLVFPHYCMGRGLMDLATNHIAAKSFRHLGIDMFQEPLQWHILGRNLVFMIVQAVLFFTLTLLIEYKVWNKIVKKKKILGTSVALTNVEDDDVLKERRRVLSGNADNGMLKIENLTKVYKVRGGNLCAVDKLCVGVGAGECFGLLGVNGAGKTTTFRMLTGDVSITNGDAYVDGASILTSPTTARSCMGYCPQFDALDPLLTAEEHLTFYARLRGIPEKYVVEEMRTNISRLNLSEWSKRRAGTYSGGNKRRLSTAIALIGDPKLIFMDEPTTGMDPRARRYLWSCIGNVVKQGRSVVLTSHSMEECEALCTRLAIMVNGRFQCIGSTQHLKTKFGDGYTVTLRVGGSPAEVERAISSIESTFPDAALKEIHHNQLVFQFPSEYLSLARLFNHMELAKQQYGVDDYSICQTTLDQVFINFAKLQNDHTRESQL